MRIAVLSGKGGTGKTLLAVNLSYVADNACYVDCDVEAPNGYLYYNPISINSQKVYVEIPTVDSSLCIGCKECVRFCRFNALAFIKGKVKVFPDICHSCGGCIRFCTAKALAPINKEIGEIIDYESDDVRILGGKLLPGMASGVPIIKELISKTRNSGTVIIDSPPGSSCSVMESIESTDYCIIVAEPTIYGAHNLSMVHELVEVMGKPFGVVLNKCLPEDNPSLNYCVEHNIDILGQIEFDHELGALNSEGSIVSKMDKYRIVFEKILDKVIKEVRDEETLNP